MFPDHNMINLKINNKEDSMFKKNMQSNSTERSGNQIGNANNL
jgi:hypothetical protein